MSLLEIIFFVIKTFLLCHFQFGIFEVPENLSDLGGRIDHDDDDDDDLEAELAALTAGDQPRRPAPRRRIYNVSLIYCAVIQGISENTD